MTFKEIANRITGVSCPVFGIQWNPLPLEIDVAKKVVNFLEDRRVLYNPYELESPSHCLQSVIKIREYLTEQLNSVDRNSELSKILRGMRMACRRLTDTGSSYDRGLHGMGDQMVFFSAMGELRGTVGFLLVQLLVTYGLDCENDLAQILPLTLLDELH